MTIHSHLTTIGLIEAEDGVLDDRAKTVLTTGGCNAFAIELNKKYEYEIVHLTVYETFLNMTIIFPYHSLCRLPDGRYQDATCIMTKDEFIGEMNDYMISGSSLFQYIIDPGRWINDHTFICHNKRLKIRKGLCPNVEEIPSINRLAKSIVHLV